MRRTNDRGRLRQLRAASAVVGTPGLKENGPVRFEQRFTVRRPPENVFAFKVEPDSLAKWQTVKSYVTPLTDGPPRLGYRVRGHEGGTREWDQVVEFTESTRAGLLASG